MPPRPLVAPWRGLPPAPSLPGALEALGHRWALVRSIDDARDELAALGIETREHPLAGAHAMMREASP
jgi:hypothetical protein